MATRTISSERGAPIPASWDRIRLRESSDDLEGSTDMLRRSANPVVMP